MTESSLCIAKIVIASPLPQLDRLFDYRIPSTLQDLIRPGMRVRIPFGRNRKLQEGLVVELSDKTDFEGDLGEIAELVSEARVLTREIYLLARAVADRQASTLSDVLRHALPDRSVAVEKSWLAEARQTDSENAKQASGFTNTESAFQGSNETYLRTTQLVEPRILDQGPKWVLEILRLAASACAKQESTIIVVPDLRDQLLLIEALAKSEFSSLVIDYSSKETKSKRYRAFLHCISQELSIVVGSRSAVFAPVQSLGQIIIWDDGDQSHREQSAPYSHTRDIALIRQQQEQCELHFLAHVRSTEVERLKQIGYLTDTSAVFTPPKLMFSESESRVDSAAWVAIREGLLSGPVLIQVLNKGSSSSAFCKNCHKRASCRSCNGPLWIDSMNQTLCRWCGANNLNFKCVDCSGSKLFMGRAGSSRTLSDFGKAFPGHTVIEATGDNPKFSIKRSNSIVVSTPGAEPFVEGGYAAVVILDAPATLAMDSLRATEEAVRVWSNAIALLSSSGRAVIVGLAGTLAEKLSFWAQDEISAFELRTRTELRFPPAVRLASLGAERELIKELMPVLQALPGVEVLGPVKVVSKGIEVESKILLKYEYSAGAQLAKSLQIETIKLSAGNKRNNLTTGRSMRPIRIRMDDFDVL